MKRQINIGLIGLGRIGRLYFQHFKSSFSKARLLAVADMAAEARQVAAQAEGVQIYEDPHSLLKNADIDAVMICSPTHTHAQLIQEAALAGKHIFCEKPLDLSIDTIQNVSVVIKDANIKFMLGFNRRFDGDFSQIRASVAAGKIGDPHLLKITSRDPAPPAMDYLKSSGGLFLDMAIHDFDMARFMIGSEVREVFAKGAVLIDKAIGEMGDIDTAVTTLTFENGTLALIDNSRQAIYGYDQRLEIFGSRGMMAVDNHQQNTYRFYDENGEHRPPLPYFFMDRYMEAYGNEINAFIDALSNDKPMPVTDKDGLMATAIALAAGKSVRKHRPVAINEILAASRDVS